MRQRGYTILRDFCSSPVLGGFKASQKLINSNNVHIQSRSFGLVKIPGMNLKKSIPPTTAAEDELTSVKRQGSAVKFYNIGGKENNLSVLTTPKLGKYALSNVLGSGRFGVIRKIDQEASPLQTKNVLNRPLAMKIMNLKLNPKVCQNEAKIYKALSSIENTDLSRYFTVPLDIFTDGDSLCIVFELLPGGDLFDIILQHGTLSEENSKKIALSLITGLDHLHFNGIIHRDIKPENVLFRVDSNKRLCFDQPVITDFGLSYMLENEDLVSSPAGTFGYASPEILSVGVSKNSSFSNLMWKQEHVWQSSEVDSLKLKADVWSLGVVFYACVCGELPFPATLDGNTTIEEHLESAHAGPKFDLPVWNEVSYECRDIIEKMLHYSPEFRPSFKQLLKHSWFKT